jgi:serine/threonine protein kinase
MARKEVDYRRMKEKERRQLVQEVNILRELIHNHIVRYQCRFVDRENYIIYIMMEYCEGGDLATVIKRARQEKYLVFHFACYQLFRNVLSNCLDPFISTCLCSFINVLQQTNIRGFNLVLFSPNCRSPVRVPHRVSREERNRASSAS